ncbi:MAG: ABC transporter substrate-binding protein [Saprospiraceae bacterium]|nr:ABC transporter substrate-binding protein [Saprospiraceae bacterium]
MIRLTDQTDTVLQFKYTPKTIISLVPSITETLIFLGLAEKIIGRTKFCIHPVDVIKKIPVIGGTKNPNIHKIKYLKPDLIIANKEENRMEDVQALRDFPVYVSDIKNTEDLIRFLNDLDQLFNIPQSLKLASDIESAFTTKPSKIVNSCYLIWKDPWMTIGKDTYIHYVMAQFGFRNVFSNAERYPEITFEDIENSDADVIMLSSEPFPFKEKHILELTEVFPDKIIILVDGEYFSWYGSRMIAAIPYLNSLHYQLLEKITEK